MYRKTRIINPWISNMWFSVLIKLKNGIYVGHIFGITIDSISIFTRCYWLKVVCSTTQYSPKIFQRINFLHISDFQWFQGTSKFMQVRCSYTYYFQSSSNASYLFTLIFKNMKFLPSYMDNTWSLNYIDQIINWVITNSLPTAYCKRDFTA